MRSSTPQPVSPSLAAGLCLAVAIAAFAAGSWSGQGRCTDATAFLPRQLERYEPRIPNRPPPLGPTAAAAAAKSGSSAAEGEPVLTPITEPTQFEPAFPENRHSGDRKAAAGASRPRQAAHLLLRDEVAFLRHKVRTLRQEYGAVHCALKGIGPTGGFCLAAAPNTSAAGSKTGTLCDGRLCTALARLLAGQSVADLGAGLGQYGKCLSTTVRQYSPYDGSEGIEAATGGRVRFLDLSEPTWAGVSYDWVMSLEVGEHIPAEKEKVFISNVLRHAKRGVVLSWAVPGQGGHYHVNEQPNAYILGRVAQLGGGRFVHNATASAALRKESSFSWFKNTLLVFDRV
ncbi:hypothetical protein TSOC_008419 [Tetrabaena socialis]|uniref:Methyltransferase type 11 domain-containing protein n=1 Tax=Tetrabaena socialis TaxID=47790 RepID=A0A2J7ZYL9_9CHLO|nr:hypothetical protein TSOC_008419 [Tetrabaena socialis]|eukprot:PNH05346.1 hypothetical protein TSOC_008419 [Tetrabaena socialis]